MCRYGHDGSRAVADENVVGDPDGHFLTVDRVDRVAAREDSALVFGEVCPVEVTLHRRLLAVGIDGGSLLGRRESIHRRMLGREDHVRCAEQCVGASRVDAKHVVRWLLREAGLRAG